MKSKKQLYACLSLEGKANSTVDQVNSSNLLASNERMHNSVPVRDHVWQEEGKCSRA
jgi:hypothetical protein